MAEEITSISLGEFETVYHLIASEPSLQTALLILFVGLTILAVTYFRFSKFVHKQAFYYKKPHLSRFVIEAILPIFAIVLVSTVSVYVYSTTLFGAEQVIEANITSTQNTFAKILNTINILVIGFTISRLIPIILTKHEKSVLELRDFEEWKELRGFLDDQCFSCKYCETEKYGLCENKPKFFNKIFKWVAPIEPPMEISKEKFEESLRTEEGRLYLENFYTPEGQPIGSYEPIVKDPFEEWKQNERGKYQKYFKSSISGKNQLGIKLHLGKTPEEIFPIDEWREQRRLNGYTILKSGIQTIGKKIPKSFQQILSIAIFGITVIGTAVWWGIDLFVLATATGGLAVGIGLALKESMENYFAYFVIRKNKIFEEGNRIKLENNYSGFIHSITPRVTYVRNALSESIAILPTRRLLNDIILNFSKEIKTVPAMVKVGVSYLHNASHVSAILVKVGKRTMQEVVDDRNRHMVVQNRCPYLEQNKPSCGCDKEARGEIEQPVVRFLKFNDSALDFAMWVYSRDFASKFKLESEMRIIMQEEFKKNDIRIPWPIRTVYTGDEKRESAEIAQLEQERSKILDEFGKGDTTYGGIED